MGQFYPQPALGLSSVRADRPGTSAADGVGARPDGPGLLLEVPYHGGNAGISAEQGRKVGLFTSTVHTRLAESSGDEKDQPRPCGLPPPTPASADPAGWPKLSTRQA